jgi:polysaccharide export outer membrane protein
LACCGALAAQVATAPQGYRIGPKDLLKISVLEDSELNREPRVDDEGGIELDYGGRVAVGGLTIEEAAGAIETALEERVLQRASVTVEILEFRSRPISIVGAVVKPGTLPLSGRWSLLHVLTEAGGLATNHGDTIYVLRRADNGLQHQLAININDLMLKADPALDIPIFANDFINIPEAVQISVHCMGEVKTPGRQTFSSNERITVLSAIASAGGLTDRASNKILVRTKSAEGTPKEIAVHFKRLLSGEEADPELGDGDFIIVKESFF